MLIPQLVVFDLGGTIVRDRGDVAAAFASALDHAGIAFDAAEIAEWRGAPQRGGAGWALPPRGRPPPLARRPLRPPFPPPSSPLSFPTVAPPFLTAADPCPL